MPRFLTSQRCVSLFFFAAGVVGAALGVHFLGGRNEGQGEPADLRAVAESPLQLASESGNFGETYESEQFTWPLRIVNVTQHDVSVTGFQSSCVCAWVTPRQIVIPAASSVVCTLNIDTRRSPPRANDRQSQETVFEIAPVLAREGALPAWTVSGRVRRTFTLNQYTLSYGFTDERKVLVKQVLIKPNINLHSVRAESTSPYWSVSVSKIPAESYPYCMEVRPKGDLVVGQFDFVVHLIPESDQKGLARTTLKVSGVIGSDFLLNPPTMMLGAQTLGSSHHETVTIVHRGGSPFDVHAKADSRDTTVQRASMTTGTQQFSVGQAVTQTGPQRSTVYFSVTTADNRTRRILFPIQYKGINE